jgi:hypothetical protein
LSHLRSSKGYDEPKILPSSIHQICLKGADARQDDLKVEAYEKDDEPRASVTIMVTAIWPIQHKPERREKKTTQQQPPPFDDDVGF